jgi:hypothetical protein
MYVIVHKTSLRVIGLWGTRQEASRWLYEKRNSAAAEDRTNVYYHNFEVQPVIQEAVL